MNQTETAYLVAYKFGERSVRGSSLSASKGIRIHLDHATANSGHVLFTVGRFPAPSEQDKIRRLMMTTRDGSYALLADVDDLGSKKIAPPEGYTVPSIWEDEDPSTIKGWFALSNLTPCKIEPGMFTSRTGNDLLVSLCGHGSLIYVPLPDESENNPTRLSVNNLPEKITLPDVSPSDHTPCIYAFFTESISTHERRCVFVGRTADFSHQLSDLSMLRSGSRPQSLISALDDPNMRIEVEILERVPFRYKNYAVDLQRLASRENFWIDCFQNRGECLEQLPAGNNLDFDTWLALKAKNHS